MEGTGLGAYDEVSSAYVRAWVQEDFGVDLTGVERVRLGADEAAVLWRGASRSGTTYAVKLSGGGSPAGLLVPADLAQQGVPGVVAPIPTPTGRLWTERAGRRLFVVPWLSGARALDGGMGAQHWVSLGKVLAQVHASAVTAAVRDVLPVEDHTHDRVASAVPLVESRLSAAGHQPADRRDASDDLVAALAQEWRGGAARQVAALLDAADELGRRLRRQQAPAVLCHGDPHLGNVLLDGAREVWLLDWDDAVLAPRERDLMFVLGGVLAFAPVTPQQQSWFFAGYGDADLDPMRLAYYRCTRALEDVVYPAAQVVDVARYAAWERADALSILRGVLSPTGLVARALSSLRELGLPSARPTLVNDA
ncbi:MAG: phosphotransferase [Actinomycetota bacterium]|nr:phosphotransferase [Actinomycetota bacterium]